MRALRATVGWLKPWSWDHSSAPRGVDATVSLGVAVLEAYGDQLAAADPEAANAACRLAAEQ